MLIERRRNHLLTLSLKSYLRNQTLSNSSAAKQKDCLLQNKKTKKSSRFCFYELLPFVRV